MTNFLRLGLAAIAPSLLGWPESSYRWRHLLFLDKGAYAGFLMQSLLSLVMSLVSYIEDVAPTTIMVLTVGTFRRSSVIERLEWALPTAGITGTWEILKDFIGTLFHTWGQVLVDEYGSDGRKYFKACLLFFTGKNGEHQRDAVVLKEAINGEKLFEMFRLKVECSIHEPSTALIRDFVFTGSLLWIV